MNLPGHPGLTSIQAERESGDSLAEPSSVDDPRCRFAAASDRFDTGSSVLHTTARPFQNRPC
jgi:hypothetical protein